MNGVAETICVDIGNSGLRCVWVPHAGALPTKLDPQMKAWSGDVLRIDWPLRLTRAGGDMVPSPLAKMHLSNLLDQWLTATAVLHIGSKQDTHDGRRRWIVSSVQREAEALLRSCVDVAHASDYRVITAIDVDLHVDLEFPDRVGVDRLLAASAALESAGTAPLIVIQAGSAITVDWVEAPRRFCGGAILPGVPMMLRLLSQAADLLPEVAADELLDLPILPGRNTAEAMFAGVSSAVVGGVQHLIARYRSQPGRQDATVVLSGGDGPRLASHLPGKVIIVDHLVLRGLADLVRQ